MKTEIDDDNRLEDWEIKRRSVMARKFKAMRKKYGLTQKELASAGDCHFNTISNFERTGNLSTEEFYKWQQVAKRAFTIKSVGGTFHKLSMKDISFNDYKKFISWLWG